MEESEGVKETHTESKNEEPALPECDDDTWQQRDEG